MCNAVRGDDARSHIEPLTLVITACSVSRWDQDNNIDNICTRRVLRSIARKAGFTNSNGLLASEIFVNTYLKGMPSQKFFNGSRFMPNIYITNFAIKKFDYISTSSAQWCLLGY